MKAFSGIRRKDIQWKREPLTLNSLSGKKVAIIGGTNGIGRALALEMASKRRVREDMGFPPLVTPSSQIVGTQATLNVIMGERYKVIPEEVKQYVRGYYGKAPAAIDPEVQRKAIGDEQPITCRPADMLSPGWEKAQAEIGSLAKSEEDI